MCLLNTSLPPKILLCSLKVFLNPISNTIMSALISPAMIKGNKGASGNCFSWRQSNDMHSSSNVLFKKMLRLGWNMHLREKWQLIFHPCFPELSAGRTQQMDATINGQWTINGRNYKWTMSCVWLVSWNQIILFQIYHCFFCLLSQDSLGIFFVTT